MEKDYKDVKPEPTIDAEPKPAAMPESTPELYIAPEPKSHKSDQVHELATLSITKGILVECEGMVWSPVSSTKPDVDVLNS